jgi:hypothetical protein
MGRKGRTKTSDRIKTLSQNTTLTGRESPTTLRHNRGARARPKHQGPSYLQRNSNIVRKTTSATTAATQATLVTTAHLSSTPTELNLRQPTRIRITPHKPSPRSDLGLQRNRSKWKETRNNIPVMTQTPTRRCHESSKKTRGGSS